MYLRGHNILEKLLGPDRYLGYRVYNYCGGAVAAGRYAAPGTYSRTQRTLRKGTGYSRTERKCLQQCSMDNNYYCRYSNSPITFFRSLSHSVAIFSLILLCTVLCSYIIHKKCSGWVIRLWSSLLMGLVETFDHDEVRGSVN